MPASANSPSGARGAPYPGTDSTLDQSAEDRRRAQDLSRKLNLPLAVPGYDVIRLLGSGAFGTVWLANQQSTGKLVAIKFYEHRGGLDWPLLHREVEKLAFLYTERDIVQLIEVGWDSEPPYYVMEYLERGSLEGMIREGPVSPEDAVRIVTEVAQALVHAHGRGILHCDLKPANVLLDHDWKIRLADFGQSRLSHEQLPALGTLFYMAPEQADMKATPDARWDVYALGALLFHLITGSPPHCTSELEDELACTEPIAQRLRKYSQAIQRGGLPVAHRRIPGVDRPLAEIVDKCLNPDPERRFANAQAVLDALNRRQSNRTRRPLLVLGLIAPIILLAATLIMGVLGWRAAIVSSEQSLVDAIQAGNVYAAKGLASTVLLRLRDISAAVEQTAQDPALLIELSQDSREGLEKFIERRQELYRGPPTRCHSWVVMSPEGKLLVRAPKKEEIVDEDFSWRDYFQGALRRAKDSHNHTVYISRVFRSKADGKYMFSISSVIPSPNNNECLGIVAATVTTGSFSITDPRRTAVLVGRKDTNVPPDQPPPDEIPTNLILLHNAFKEGAEALEVQNQVILRMQEQGYGTPPDRDAARDDYYNDPLGKNDPAYQGRWLSGFAPVGTEDLPTQFVVIVQQRFDEAVGPVRQLAATLALRGWIALSIGVILMAAIWYLVQRVMAGNGRAATNLVRPN